MKYVNQATDVAILLKDYEKKNKIGKPSKLKFEGVDGYDVYNISSVFKSVGKEYIAGRVEKRDSEISKVGFFEKIGENVYKLDETLPFLINVQDPFVTFLKGELVVGGTQIDLNPINMNQIIGWRTIFFKGVDINSLKFWTTGPHKMKDVRIAEWKDKFIVFARPQGGKAGYGKIAVIMADSLDQITAEFISKAQIEDVHFLDGQWGGVNEPHILKNGLLGIMGHISCRDDKMLLHYYPMAFAFNPVTGQSTRVKIVACRKDFENGESKRPDLEDVLFTGGLNRIGGGKALLYTGVSDCEAHVMEIDDPFIEYEYEQE